MENQLKQGAWVIRTIGEVMVSDASPEVAVVFDDIQRSLRVPFVNFIFRALARRPAYFLRAWPLIAPGIQRQAFEDLTDQIRARAREVVSSWPGAEVVWPVGEDGEQLRRFTSTILYVLPQLVAVATALHTDRIQPTAETLAGEARKTSLLPGGLGLPMVSVAGAPASVAAVFSDIQQRHGHPGVASYYRALGQWPDFLSQAWGVVAPYVDTSAFRAARQTLLVDVDVGVGRLFTQTMDSGMRPDGDIRSLLGFFRHRLAADLLLDVSLLSVRGGLPLP